MFGGFTIRRFYHVLLVATSKVVAWTKSDEVLLLHVLAMLLISSSLV